MIKPAEATEDSIKKRGAQLIVDKKCIECHGVEGRGDGNKS
ncbi:MAG: c-type cytochrome [Nitrospira sp.]|nr:c-type cytochrome [Nitrospira sp.]